MIGPPSTAASTRIHQAVEVVYRAFEAPPPALIEGCPCCLDTRGVDVLLVNPLRGLTGLELWRYVTGAFLTVGSERDFRYLLPRILEISASDPGNSPGPEIVLGKLPLANWRSWSPSEQGATEAFVDAWFEAALVRDLADVDEGSVGDETEQVLCGAARAGLPLASFLVRLREPWASPVLEHLKDRISDKPIWFWEDVPEGHRELWDFLAQQHA